MVKKRKVEDLSVEELEKALLLKRRQARLERFQRLSKEGYSPSQALTGTNQALDHLLQAQVKTSLEPESEPVTPLATLPAKPRQKKITEMLLLGLEVIAVAGLVGVLTASYFNLQELNNEVSLAQQKVLAQQAGPTPTPEPAIALKVLPGGHSAPTSPGGAAPDVPLHLQQWVQPQSSTAAGAIEIRQPSANAPTRLVIPKIGVDAPIVKGVGWEDLKKGVGHLPNSAHPGERGNMYLAAHNDIYGEIFRYLEELELGDEYFVYAGQESFRYVVKERRIIKPTEVEVMLPTTEPVTTLQTCYPYLVNTHRLVVIGELAE